jgi:hypothetical protein
MGKAAVAVIGGIAAVPGPAAAAAANPWQRE